MSDRDPLRSVVWGCALLLGSLELALAPERLWRAAAATAEPFLTLAAILAGALVVDRLGCFPLLAGALSRASRSKRAAVSSALLLTAVLSGLVNLDVAVVVAMPVALGVARRVKVSAGWLAVATAITANATSFLLPTSNVTTLLLLSPSVPFGPYLAGSWMAWTLVTALTVPVLSVLVSRWESDPAPNVVDGGIRAGAVLDLLPMFLVASAIRALLANGVLPAGPFVGQAAIGSAFAAIANNLPAAAAVYSGGRTVPWGAVLAMAIGPNLLITGSVATLICRRIARDGGATLRPGRFTALGAALVPAQLSLAALGLRLAGALR